MSKTLSALLLTPILLFQASHSGQPARRSPQTPVASKAACSDVTALPANRRTPEACAEVALYGRPVLFPARNGIAYGVSAMPDKPLTVHIWMGNHTEKPQTTYLCCNTTFVRYIDLYDQSGQRTPSRLEIANAKSPLADPLDPRAVENCGCSGWSTVPAHSLKVIDHGNLSTSYALASGRYTIVEYVPPSPAATNAPPASPMLPPSGPRLSISVP